jgi:hypothetical protein
VHEFALVVHETRNVPWPFEVIENSSSVDEELGFVFNDGV